MGPPQTDAEGAFTVHVGRGTWRHRADGREDHRCMRASQRQDRGWESLPWSLMIGALRYDSPSGAVEPLQRQEKDRVTCDGSTYRAH
jgi:hypothetical protein